jgi:hypothetical protein
VFNEEHAIEGPQMIELLVAVGVLLVFDVLVCRFGVDSRDGNDWADHNSTRQRR